MDNNLNILEAKVLEAVALIRELRAENACRELVGQNADLEEAGHRLKHELDESRQSAEVVEVFEQKRMEIEDKVGDLLQKLEAMS